MSVLTAGMSVRIIDGEALGVPESVHGALGVVAEHGEGLVTVLGDDDYWHIDQDCLDSGWIEEIEQEPPH
jgi:hypothetical protein